MSRNMGTIDGDVRGFLVAPAAVVAAFLIGAGTVAGIVLFAPEWAQRDRVPNERRCEP